MLKKLEKIFDMLIPVFLIIVFGSVFLCYIYERIKYDVYFRWVLLGVAFLIIMFVVWLKYIDPEEGKVFEIIDFIFPVFIFDIFYQVSKCVLYKFKKLNFEDIYFQNNFIYKDKDLYTGRIFLNFGNMNIYINDLLKTKWGEGLNYMREDKDEYDSFFPDVIFFKCYNGMITKREEYRLENKREILLKTVEFTNYSQEIEIKTYYARKKILVFKKEKNGIEFYRRELNYEKGLARTYIDGNLIEEKVL